MKFPHYFTTEVKNKETGEKELKEFECVGTAYIAEKTGIPSRTIRWRAKQGLIPKTKRMGISKNERPVYFWLTERPRNPCPRRLPVAVPNTQPLAVRFFFSGSSNGRLWAMALTVRLPLTSSGAPCSA